MKEEEYKRILNDQITALIEDTKLLTQAQAINTSLTGESYKQALIETFTNNIDKYCKNILNLFERKYYY